MKLEQPSHIEGVWSFTWRSIAYMPTMLTGFVLLLVIVFAMFAVPVFGVVSICQGHYPEALLSFAFWPAIVWAGDRFRVVPRAEAEFDEEG